jgi:hypothetical protein
VAVTNVGFLWSGGWRRRLERRACRQILAESRERVECLANLADLPTAEAAHAIRPALVVEWSTRAQVDAAITRAVKQQEIDINQLVLLLASAGALKNSELGVRLRLTVRIDDQRNDRSVSLPQFLPVELRFQ